MVWWRGWCSWGHRQHSSSSKHGELSWCQRATFWSHLTTTLSPSSPLNHWQTSDGPVHVLSWAGGPCGHCRNSVLYGVVCYQLFSWWLWSQLPWDHWQNHVVLGWFLTVLMITRSPALCRSTILSLTSLDSSLALAMVESLESDWLIASVDRCLLTSWDKEHFL